MKLKSPDVSVNLPSELLDSLSIAINYGIQKANINQKDKKNLKLWWEVESSLIREK